MQTIREYSIGLLKESNCNLDCYAETSYFNGQKRHSGYDDALKDLKYLKETENKTFPFPIEDIARELVSIGNEQPTPPRKGHKRYCMVFNTEDCTDGIEFDTFEEAKIDMEETYVNWRINEMSSWKTDENGNPCPTPEQIEGYDYMIDNCCCYISEWDEESGCYNDMDNSYWMPDEELEEIGYVEWDKLKKQCNNTL
jgi:hypothetical protein